MQDGSDPLSSFNESVFPAGSHAFLREADGGCLIEVNYRPSSFLREHAVFDDCDLGLDYSAGQRCEHMGNDSGRTSWQSLDWLLFLDCLAKGTCVKGVEPLKFPGGITFESGEELAAYIRENSEPQKDKTGIFQTRAERVRTLPKVAACYLKDKAQKSLSEFAKKVACARPSYIASDHGDIHSAVSELQRQGKGAQDEKIVALVLDVSSYIGRTGRGSIPKITLADQTKFELVRKLAQRLAVSNSDESRKAPVQSLEDAVAAAVASDDDGSVAGLSELSFDNERDDGVPDVIRISADAYGLYGIRPDDAPAAERTTVAVADLDFLRSHQQSQLGKAGGPKVARLGRRAAHIAVTALRLLAKSPSRGILARVTGEAGEVATRADGIEADEGDTVAISCMEAAELKGFGSWDNLDALHTGICGSLADASYFFSPNKPLLTDAAHQTEDTIDEEFLRTSCCVVATKASPMPAVHTKVRTFDIFYRNCVLIRIKGSFYV